VRIGIVNDMPLAVEALRRAVALERAHRTVWVAHDGAEAVECCARELPDLVLMDLIMPGMNGVEATRRIMAATPCPILIVTSSVGDNAAKAYEAMGYGALDAVDTPILGLEDIRASAAPLLIKISNIGKLVGDRVELPLRTKRTHVAANPGKAGLVVIGASAGGPAALAAILAGLPGDFSMGIVIVQHVDRQFAAGMAEWLNRSSALPVRLAEEGDAPVAGSVLLAGSNDHLCFKSSDWLGYTVEPKDYAYRPSVDVFFNSVCKHWPGRAVGVLLTGMGRDGAAGLKALHAKGGHTIVQDRVSCAVFGMPKAAIALDAATEILPLSRIAQRLLALAGALVVEHAGTPGCARAVGSQVR
jgi:two-component system response regulator WspF